MMMSNGPKALLNMLFAIMCFMTAGFFFLESRLISQKKYDESFLYYPAKKTINKLTEVLSD